ncbi:MAG TPA: hypothetical protein VN783_02585, partial [Thermoanaerobaculia bacterium]|nr:hypothetical protein [Thermoanaerobaculia bacterium]
GDRFVALATAALALLALGAIAAWWQARSGRAFAAASWLAAGMAGLALAAAFLLLPAFDAVKSARQLSRVLVSRAAPGEPYAIYPRLDPTFLFYTERFAAEPASEAELQAFARRPERVWVLVERDTLARLREPLPLAEIARDADPLEGYVLFGPRDGGRPWQPVPVSPAGPAPARRAP